MVIVSFLGGVWFILFLAVWLIFCGFASKKDNILYGAITLISGAILSDLLFGTIIFSSILANPLLLIGGLIAYSLVGIIDAMVRRWPRFLKSRQESIEKNFEIWSMAEVAPSFEKFLDSASYASNTAVQNKNRIASYVLMWPFSFVAFIVTTPCEWIYNSIHTYLGDTFDSIGKKYTLANHKKLSDARKKNK